MDLKAKRLVRFAIIMPFSIESTYLGKFPTILLNPVNPLSVHRATSLYVAGTWSLLRALVAFNVSFSLEPHYIQFDKVVCEYFPLEY
jgi:hypothetical protein